MRTWERFLGSLMKHFEQLEEGQVGHIGSWPGSGDRTEKGPFPPEDLTQK